MSLGKSSQLFDYKGIYFYFGKRAVSVKIFTHTFIRYVGNKQGYCPSLPKPQKGHLLRLAFLRLGFPRVNYVYMGRLKWGRVA
jgi:hypothetical protein